MPTVKPKRGRGRPRPEPTIVQKAAHLFYLLMSQQDFASAPETAESLRWGSERVLRRIQFQINQAWEEFSGERLFEVVDGEGRTWRGVGERYLRLTASSLLQTHATNAALLPVMMMFVHMTRDTLLPHIHGTLFKEGDTPYRERQQQLVASLRNRFHFVDTGVGDYQRQSTQIEAIYQGLLHNKVVEVTRTGERGETVVEMLAPLTMTMCRRRLQLVTANPDDPSTDVRIHDVASLKAVRTCSRGFQYPADYHPSRLFPDGFSVAQGDEVVHVVELEIQDQELLAELKAARWTAADEYYEHGGTPCLRFKARDLAQVKGWVQSLGAGVRVLSPETLRQAIADEAQAMMALYAPPVRVHSRAS